MKETRITCLCPQIALPDLGLTLTKGQVVYLAPEKAAKSRDLALARQYQGVRQEEVTRCTSQRAQEAPPVRPVVVQVASQTATAAREALKGYVGKPVPKTGTVEMAEMVGKVEEALESVVPAPAPKRVVRKSTEKKE